MTIRNVLVHLDNAIACEARVNASVEVAKRFAGNVTGHYSRPQVSAMAMADMGGTAIVYQQMTDDVQADFEAAEQAFERMMKSAPVRMTWATDDRPLFDGLVAAARYSDLVVVGQHDPADPRCTAAGLAAHVALTAGTPVLVVPPAGVPLEFGSRSVIAWNGSREGTRALHDSLPFLAGADEIHAIGFDESALDLEKLTSRLSAHELIVHPHALSSDGGEIGLRLLEEVDRLAGDLLVLGAYGHSRVREFMLGGVTRTLLTEANVPLLISH